MNEFNSTELFEEGMSLEGNGEQESVVDSPESQHDGFDADGDGQEEGVDPHVGSGNEEGSDQGENNPAPAGQGGARRQTREENSAARLARLRAERDTTARMTAETDEKIARMGMKNPATGELIKNMAELEAFGKLQRDAEIRDIAKRSGRSASEVEAEMDDRDFIRRMRRENEEKERAAAAAVSGTATEDQRRDFVEKDAQDFQRKHPNVNVAELVDNPHFLEFCGSRFTREPLAGLYESYMKLTGEAESAGRAGAQSRKSRSTGSGGGGGGVLTPSQRASLDAWNRDNPDMKMTAKEFLAR